MKINNISNGTSFGKVYAIAGKKHKLERFTQKANKEEGYLTVLDATDLYYRSRIASAYGVKEAFSNDHVSLFVTGKEDTDNVKNKKEGWSSLEEIGHNMYRFYSLSKDAKAPMKEILREIKKD
ncbi:hypothetical protein II906_10525 [bacterium]|nr:hypothetical protein [bacterium]